jgi:hypothetical protein
MDFDAKRREIVLFGGSGAAGDLADMWTWNGVTWTNIVSGVTPTPRDGASLTFDPTTHRFVLFGGEEGNSILDDTWLLHLRGGACAADADCDTGHCVDGTCCESAACGTCQACNLGANSGVCTKVTSADDPDTCTGANTCDTTGACKPKPGSASCGSDGHTLMYPGGMSSDCAPYVCAGSTCRTTCASVLDCSMPNVCTTGGVCSSPAAATADANTGRASSGCAFAGGSGADGADGRAAALGFLAALVARRRKRSRDGSG